MVYVPPKDARSTKQVIVVRSDLGMVVGKEGSQVAHAAMAFLTRQLVGKMPDTGSLSIKIDCPALHWINTSFKKVVLAAPSEDVLLQVRAAAVAVELHVDTIVDSGLTQFDKPTLTCIAIGPDYEDKIDPITKDGEFGLKLR